LIFITFCWCFHLDGSSSDKTFSILLCLNKSSCLLSVSTFLYSDLYIFPHFPLHMVLSLHSQHLFIVKGTYCLQHFSKKQSTTCTKRTEDMNNGGKQDI
jgi:hypothetical protein